MLRQYSGSILYMGMYSLFTIQLLRDCGHPRQPTKAAQRRDNRRRWGLSPRLLAILFPWLPTAVMLVAPYRPPCLLYAPPPASLYSLGWDAAEFAGGSAKGVTVVGGYGCSDACRASISRSNQASYSGEKVVSPASRSSSGHQACLWREKSHSNKKSHS